MQLTEQQQAKSFIDELLEEAEQKERQEIEAYLDMAIREIAELQSAIERTNEIAEKDIELIRRWAVNENLKRTERIEMLKSKLDSYIRSTDKKTITLPHGTLKLRRKPDKVEVTDLELFIKNATKEMVTVVPEQIKPSLPAIKKWIKMTGKIPEGVKLIEGEVEFSLKLNNYNLNKNKTEEN